MIVRKEYAAELAKEPVPLASSSPNAPLLSELTAARAQKRAKNQIVTISVPPEHAELLREIDAKVYRLGHKQLYKGEKWYLGLKVLSLLLDYLDAQHVDQRSDLYAAIQLTIENLLKE